MISGVSLVNLFIATTLCPETIVCTNKVISEGGTFDVVRETQTNLDKMEEHYPLFVEHLTNNDTHSLVMYVRMYSKDSKATKEYG